MSTIRLLLPRVQRIIHDTAGAADNDETGRQISRLTVLMIVMRNPIDNIILSGNYDNAQTHAMTRTEETRGPRKNRKIAHEPVFFHVFRFRGSVTLHPHATTIRGSSKIPRRPITCSSVRTGIRLAFFLDSNSRD